MNEGTWRLVLLFGWLGEENSVPVYCVIPFRTSMRLHFYRYAASSRFGVPVQAVDRVHQYFFFAFFCFLFSYWFDLEASRLSTLEGNLARNG